jgi:hypothetical protein
MNVNKIHEAYEKAINVMLEAGMPLDLAEKAVQSITELVLATINAQEEIENAAANK